MKMRSLSALLFLGSLAVAGCSETATEKPVAQNKPAVSPAAAPAVKPDAKIVDGKVADAKVLRSIPLLDSAALDAVRQWEFTPTLLNGVPVPVIMTVTVNFTLQ
jgi:hypothetical protein